MNMDVPKELSSNDKPFESEENSEVSNSELDEDNHSLLKLEFDGRAYIFSPDHKYNKEQHNELIRILNKYSREISAQIEKEIKARAPVGLDVKTQLEFKFGSVDFQGIIQIVDFLDKLNSAKELIISVTTLILNSIIRREIEDRGNVTVSSINTNVAVGKVGKDNFNLYTKFLWWCSGAVIGILKECPTDKIKYETIGAAVFTTGLLAFLSGGYAMYTVFDGDNNALFYSLGFGLLWSCIIFNLDKSIVSSMRKETREEFNWFQRFLKEFPLAIPRIILAVLLGITISKPLELRLFQSPIHAQIELSKDKYAENKVNSLFNSFSNRINEIDSRINAINQQNKAADDKVSLAQSEYNHEIDGSGGTRRYGVGRVAREKRILLASAKEEYSNIFSRTKEEMDSLIKEKSDISKQIIEESQNAKKDIKEDFLTRIQALWVIASDENDRSVYWVNWAIIFMIIAIELSPILVKLLSPPGIYDARLLQREDSESREAELRKKTVIKEAEYNSESAVSEAKFNFESEVSVAEHKRNAKIDVSKNHYNIVVESEKMFDGNFFHLANEKRQNIMRDDFDRWANDINKQDLTFEDLYKIEKKRLSLNKNISI